MFEICNADQDQTQIPTLYPMNFLTLIIYIVFHIIHMVLMVPILPLSEGYVLSTNLMYMYYNVYI